MLQSKSVFPAALRLAAAAAMVLATSAMGFAGHSLSAAEEETGTCSESAHHACITSAQKYHAEKSCSGTECYTCNYSPGDICVKYQTEAPDYKDPNA
jgi:hypothetical protein